MIHKRMITLRQIIGALFHICVATATLSHGITYHEYSKIQSSEIDVEVDHIDDVSIWWEDATESGWKEAFENERSFTRRLRHADGFENNSNPVIFKFPFLVCNRQPHLSGLARLQSMVRHFAIHQDDYTVLLNSKQETCISLGISPTLASKTQDTMNDFHLLPLTNVMKIRRGVVESIVNEIKLSQGNAEIYLQFGSWMKSTSKDVFLEGIFGSTEYKEMLRLSKPINVHNMIIRTINYRKDERALLWHRALSSENCKIEHDINDQDLYVSLTLSSNDSGREDCMLLPLLYLAAQPEIESISSKPSIGLYNIEAQWIVQSGIDGYRPWFDVGLTGNDQVVSVSDTGLDVDNCYFYDASGAVDANKEMKVDHSRRKVVQYYSHVDGLDYELGHGTHVVGTIIGAKSVDGNHESDGFADGCAKSAKVAFFDIGDNRGSLSLPGTIRKLFEPGLEAGAMIHSSSWGRKSAYDIISQAFDKFIYEHENFLSVTAAGNHGDGEDSIIEPANAKNVIAVGASQSSGGDLYWYDYGMDHIAYFSSHGPTDGGKRIKPDIVAPGRTILSAGSKPNMSGECDGDTKPELGKKIPESVGLMYAEGTSMATPVVAGTAAQIRQYFEEGFYPTGKSNREDSFTPSGSLLKAIILNGGKEMVGIDNVGYVTVSSPFDGAQGFGRVSLSDSLPIKGKTNFKAKVFDRQLIEEDQKQSIEISVDISEECDSELLSATLVWMDLPSSPGCQQCLLNNIDLELRRLSDESIHFPNGLDKDDDSNNVERVRIAVEDGDRFRLTVNAANLITASQTYSLVVTGCFHIHGSLSVNDEPSLSPLRTSTISPSSLSLISSQAPSHPPSNLPSPSIHSTIKPSLLPSTSNKVSSFPSSNMSSLKPSSLPTAHPSLQPTIESIKPTSFNNSFTGEESHVKTLLDWDKYVTGMMFDVTAKTNLSVTSLQLMKNKRLSNAEIEIYARQGSHVGFETNLNEWVKIYSAAPDVNGNLTKSLFSLITISKGATCGFYVTVRKVKNKKKKRKIKCNSKWDESPIAFNGDINVFAGPQIKYRFRKKGPICAFVGKVFYTINHNYE